MKSNQTVFVQDSKQEMFFEFLPVYVFCFCFFQLTCLITTVSSRFHVRGISFLFGPRNVNAVQCHLHEVTQHWSRTKAGQQRSYTGTRGHDAMKRVLRIVTRGRNQRLIQEGQQCIRPFETSLDELANALVFDPLVSILGHCSGSLTKHSSTIGYSCSFILYAAV